MTSSAASSGPVAAAVRRAGPLALTGLATNGASVVVTVVIARLLATREYGAWAQLVGLFLVLMMPGLAVLVAVVRRVAAWERAGLADQVDPWAAQVRRRATAGLAVFAIVAWALRGWLAARMSLPDASGVAEVLVAGGGWLLLSIDRGLLQGRRAYGALARNLAVETAARTTVTMTLVALGAGVEGAALGLVAAMAGADLHARRALRVVGTEPLDGVAADDGVVAVPPAHTRRHLAADALTALLALALLAVLQSVDVIIVGSEAPRRSGAYAAISVASKAIVFGALTLSGYLVPEAAARWHRGENAFRQLGAALALVALPAAALVGMALVDAHRLLAVVFGERLAGAAPALATLALSMTCLATTVLLTHYLLAVGRRRVVALLAAGAVTVALLVHSAHGRPVATARWELAGQAAIALAAGVMVATVHRPARRHALA